MRGRVIGVKYIPREAYNEIASRNGSPLCRWETESVYAEIQRLEMIDTKEELCEMFYPYRDDIRFMWIPGPIGIGKSIKGFREQKEDIRYYNELFNEALCNDKPVIQYSSDSHRRGMSDEFTFISASPFLVLERFQILTRNANLYKLAPPLPESTKAIWLHGISDIAELLHKARR